MYDSTLGQFLTRDPAKADKNLYRYVGNSPTNKVDPTGLYEEEWEGTWSADDKAKVKASFRRVHGKAFRLLTQIDSIDLPLACANSSEAEHILYREVTNLRRVVHSVLKGLASKGENLEIYNLDFGPESDGWARLIGNPVLDNELQFNNRKFLGNNWRDLTDDQMDETVFHELSHAYGTEDDDTKGILMNAYNIQSLINKPFTNSPEYKLLKMRAKK